MKPPVARRVAHPHERHGDVRTDDYYWLRERENTDVLAYLQAENAYYEEAMRAHAPFVEHLYQDLLAHIEEDHVEVPARHGPYFYYTRVSAGQQYRVHARKHASSRSELDAVSEEVLLDLNALAGSSAFYGVTVVKPSPDHRLLAYLENRDGTDRYTLRVKDLQSGVLLPEAIADVFLHDSLEWDAEGRHLFYLTVDATQRAYRVWRHCLGDTAGDTLLYEEDDPTFSLRLGKSRSGRHLFLASENKTTDEVRFLRADDPMGQWQMFRPRTRGIKYALEDWRDDLLVLTNDGAENFRLLACPLTDPRPEHSREVFHHDPGMYLEDVLPFRDALLLVGRQEGLTRLWVYQDAQIRRLEFAEPLYTVRTGHNLEYDTDTALIEFQSLITPRTVLELHLGSNEQQVLRQDRVPMYEPQAYQQERLWATAADGVRVPMSVIYRKGALDQGPAPLWLYGYGSYGFSMDPTFRTGILPLLDRGAVFVIAHVRGGAEMGYGWYLDGKLMHKKHTFTDFIACAEELVHLGYTTPGKLAAEGRSAGGLLMGAVMNLRPDLFRVVLAGVPFVDVVTTMLDASIPLTSLEWDEWGNPEDAESYAYMKAYSPYDNVAAKDYPHCLVTTGLNDPRVSYWEPAKWVARLRATKTDDRMLLLRTHMGAGHGGSSGRYDHLRETAQEMAFMMDKIGLHD